MPTSIRPPEAWSAVTAILARTEGCRNVTGERQRQPLLPGDALLPLDHQADPHGSSSRVPRFIPRQRGEPDVAYHRNHLAYCVLLWRRVASPGTPGGELMQPMRLGLQPPRSRP